MNSENTAKTVLLSTVLTALIIFSTAYILRSNIAEYFLTLVDLPQVEDLSRPEEVTNDIVATIEEVNPAVVSVIVTKNMPVYENYYESFNPGVSLNSYSIPRVRENGIKEKEVGGGSGFVVSNDGMIVTNRHVVDYDDAKYSILLNTGESYEVKVLARDPQFDIAILKITEPPEKALTFVKFGNSDELKLGESVIVIGNALAEFRNSVSVGVVSGLARTVTASDMMGNYEQLDQVIQTDAAINPGNSGGPLLNTKGEVVGVNVATTKDFKNISFALPSSVVEKVVDSVREYGEIIRPFMGVSYIMLNEHIAELNNLSISFGALITNNNNVNQLAVMPGSPADKSGILDGDIIISIDGVSLEDKDLSKVLRGKEVGQEIKIELVREGEQKVISLTLNKAL